MPFPEWTPPKVSDEPGEPGWGPAGDLRRSMGVLKHAPPTPQEQRIAELEAALRALTARSPILDAYGEADTGVWCFFCRREQQAHAAAWDQAREEHEPGCPLVGARALLPPPP